MPTATVEYTDNLRTQATHLQSGNSLITDAPTDNQGRGEAFSPSDLMSTSLLSCMMTIVGILANRKGWDISGMKGTVQKYMADQPRRVHKIEIQLSIPDRNWTDADRKMIEQAAKTCPVALSLHPDIIQELNIEYTNA
jgi:putative redox protein